MVSALVKRSYLRSYSVACVCGTILSLGSGLFNDARGSGSVSEVKDFSIYQPYVSPRALGMGNAFTAVADDYSAMFYNPAALARRTDGDLNFGIGAMVDSKISKFVKDVQDASKGSDPTTIENLLSTYNGKHFSARAPTINAIIARPGWAVAIIPADLSMEMGIHNLGGESLALIGTEDTTIAFARGWDAKWFEKSRISFGITGKAIYRAYYNKALFASDLYPKGEIFRKQDATEGLTADADLGTLFTPDVGEDGWLHFIKPTLGFTIRNVADYGFSKNLHLIDKSTGKPVKLGRRFDLGSMFELPDFWIFKTRVAADLRDMGQENWTFKKGSHVGFEFLWKVRSWWQGGWRVGLNQGYLTAGFTGRVGIFNLDLATYAEEVGPSDEPLASRRYVAKVSLDW